MELALGLKPLLPAVEQARLREIMNLVGDHERHQREISLIDLDDTWRQSLGLSPRQLIATSGGMDGYLAALGYPTRSRVPVKRSVEEVPA